MTPPAGNGSNGPQTRSARLLGAFSRSRSASGRADGTADSGEILTPGERKAAMSSLDPMEVKWTLGAFVLATVAGITIPAYILAENKVTKAGKNTIAVAPDALLLGGAPPWTVAARATSRTSCPFPSSWATRWSAPSPKTLWAQTAPRWRRVVLQPVLGCAARGIQPPCHACAAGDVGNCGYPLQMGSGSAGSSSAGGFGGASGAGPVPPNLVRLADLVPIIHPQQRPFDEPESDVSPSSGPRD